MSLVRFKECLFLHTHDNRSHLFEIDTFAQCEKIELTQGVIYKIDIGYFRALLTPKDAKRALEFLDEISEA